MVTSSGEERPASLKRSASLKGGRVIARARRQAGMTQSELARRLGTTTSAVSRWEHGRVEPAFELVDRAVAACGVDLGSLLSEPELDPQEASFIETSLSLSAAERLERLIAAVAFIEAARADVVPA